MSLPTRTVPILPRTLRGRLTAIFAIAATLIVVAGAGLLLADQKANGDRVAVRALHRRIDAIVQSLTGAGRALPVTETYAQVITSFGTVRDLSPAIGSNEFLLTTDQLRLAFNEGSLRVNRSIPALGGPSRLLAEARTIDGTPVVVVVGASRELEARARHRLIGSMVLAGPTLVVLIVLGGWLLAGAALRPVRRMTDTAGEISRADTGQRLALPTGDDEIAHLARTLNAMLDRLAESFRREQSFVDDASHELRTPLAVLRGELELALLHPGDAAETRATLESSLQEVERLSTLAEDLLVLARASAGATADTAEPVELLGLARSTATRVAAALDRPVDVQVEGESVLTRVPAAHVQRIVTNLVTNAGRFAARRVVVRTSAEGDDAVLSVSDDGPGFPADLLPRAFERFTVGTASRARSQGTGTGIGLAIVQALTTAAGGSVHADNEGIDGGARVVCRFRLEPQPND